MKLALSGRLFEARGGYTLSLHEFLGFARETGYDGVEIRYPQLPLETPPEQWAEVRRRLADLGLTWVFGTVEGIADDRLFERAVRTLEHHVSCGCLFTRFTVSKAEQLERAQRFADEAAKRGARLLIQLHSGTLADSVPHALDTFRELARPNVGLAFEPNHLVFGGDPEYVDAVARLAPLIVSVSLQNYKAAPPGALEADRITIGGKAYVRALPGDPGGLHFPAVFRALKAARFDGFATVMCDAYPGLDSRELARRWLAALRPLT